MEKIVLKAREREKNTVSIKDLRAQRMVPAEVYGHGKKNHSVSVHSEDFRKVYRAAGGNTIVDLEIDDAKAHKVLIHDVQLAPVSGDFLHIDFYTVNLKEKITTSIPLELIGVSPAVKDYSGILIQSLDEVEVECLPTDLVHSIQVDISSLVTFGDSIRLSDITLPKGMEMLDDPETTIATVQEPKEEVIEDTAPEAPVDIPTTAQKSEQPEEPKEE